MPCCSGYSINRYSIVIITISRMLLTPHGLGTHETEKVVPWNLRLTLFIFLYKIHWRRGGTTQHGLTWNEQHEVDFSGDMVYLQQSYPPNSTIHGSKSSLSMGKGPRAACCSVYYSVHNIDRLMNTLLHYVVITAVAGWKIITITNKN